METVLETLRQAYNEGLSFVECIDFAIGNEQSQRRKLWDILEYWDSGEY